VLYSRYGDITTFVNDYSHQHSDPQSKHLCDLVFEAVGADFPDLARKEKKTWCTFAQPSRSIVFYARHGSGHITIWPRWDSSDAEDLQKAALDIGLRATVRNNVDDSWANRHPIKIEVLRAADVDAVRPLLLHAVSQIATANLPTAYRGLRFAQETPPQSSYPEGSKRAIIVNAYERNTLARLACISYYGLQCSVCDLDFGQQYGVIGEGFIHVHHLLPLSSVGPNYKVDPKQDMRPVCPNCHEMLHRRQPPYSIKELKDIVKHQVASR
jgi:predicted HNH restriction endonuclease